MHSQEHTHAQSLTTLAAFAGKRKETVTMLVTYVMLAVMFFPASECLSQPEFEQMVQTKSEEEDVYVPHFSAV